MLELITWVLAAYGAYCALTKLFAHLRPLVEPKPAPVPKPKPQSQSKPKKEPKPKNGDMRISHIEGYGYIPEIFDEFRGFEVIDKIAASTTSREIALRWPEDYFHRTEAGAGETINLYHRHHLGENNTIWTSRQAA